MGEGGKFKEKIYMKIIDGLKLEGWPVEIPDCGRDDLPVFFTEMGYKVGVEIGVWSGEFGKVLASTGLKLYGIDPYKAHDDLWAYGKQENFDKAYELTKQTLKDCNYTIIRKTSMEAVKDFADESIDFVYIDGNHLYKYVLEDIIEWTKKVKKGGVISGHDYIWFYQPRYNDVKHVVKHYTREFGIKKWYVLGSREKKEGVKRDKFRSWFWIK